jgi:hypothetical protein
MRSMRWLDRGVRTIVTLPIEGVVHECVEGGEVLQVQLFPLQRHSDNNDTTQATRLSNKISRASERKKTKR